MKFEGNMEGGHSVFSLPQSGVLIYAVQVGNAYASETTTKTITVPNFGDVIECDDTLTSPKFAGNMLSWKLRFFLVNHLGKSIMLGKVHSVATEKSLPKISNIFNMKMINIKTGELIDWTVQNYEQLSHKFEVTDWRVLLLGCKTPFNQMECMQLPCSAADRGRHKWTYGNWFENFIDAAD
jgi:hypothetical protein